MDSGTRLTAKDATEAKPLANSMSPWPESNGRRPGPGFGPKSEKGNLKLIGLPEQSWDLEAFIGYG